MIRHAVLAGEEVKVPLIYGPGKLKEEASSNHLHLWNSPISSELTQLLQKFLFYVLKMMGKGYV